MNNKIIIIALVFWLPFIYGSQILKAKNLTKMNIVLKSEKLIDNCDTNSRNVLVSVSLGKISKIDSLYGCNFQMSFDSNKIKFTDLIKMSTLFEYFKNTSLAFSEKGKAIGYGANLGSEESDIVYGDMPLFGVYGKWIGLCNDTCVVKLDFIEFTSEFGKEVDTIKNVSIVSISNFKSDIYLNIENKKDLFKTSDKLQSTMTLKSDKVSNLLSGFKIIIKKDFSDNYYLSDFTTSSKNIEITDIKDSNNSYILTIKKNNVIIFNDNIDFAINRKSQINDTIYISPKINYNDECNCFNFTSNDTLMIINKDNTFVDNNISENVKYFNNLLTLRNVNDINNFKIVNVLGHVVYEKIVNNENDMYDLNYLQSGIYFLVLEKNNRNKSIIKIIKN